MEINFKLERQLKTAFVKSDVTWIIRHAQIKVGYTFLETCTCLKCILQKKTQASLKLPFIPVIRRAKCNLYMKRKEVVLASVLANWTRHGLRPIFRYVLNSKWRHPRSITDEQLMYTIDRCKSERPFYYSEVDCSANELLLTCTKWMDANCKKIAQCFLDVFCR